MTLTDNHARLTLCMNAILFCSALHIEETSLKMHGHGLLGLHRCFPLRRLRIRGFSSFSGGRAEVYELIKASDWYRKCGVGWHNTDVTAGMIVITVAAPSFVSRVRSPEAVARSTKAFL